MRFRFGIPDLLLAVFVAGVGLALYQRIQRDDEICVRHTGRELDIAIVGRGHFQVTDSETGEIHYTRRGRLHVTPHGALALGPYLNSPLLDPPICIPPDTTRITISSDGCVQYSGHDGNNYVVGGLELAVFPDDAALKSVGDHRYAAPDETICCIQAQPGGPDGAGFLQQFWLEEKRTGDVIEPRLLIALACAAGFFGLCWVKRRLDAMEASMNRLAMLGQRTE